MELAYVCSICGEVESFNPGSCPLCGGVFKRKEEKKNERLDQLLNEISSIFDCAYEYSEADADKEYICEVENKLRNYLKEKGLI